jgi:hypothetical protein
LHAHWDPATFPLGEVTSTPIAPSATPVEVDPADQTEVNEQVSIAEINFAQLWWDETGMEIVRTTGSCVQYGTLAFAVICIVIGAVEALAGR